MDKYRVIAILFYHLFSLLPLKMRKIFFKGLAKIYYLLFPRHRLIALYNVRQSFPGMELKEVIGIAKGAFENVALVAAEFFSLKKLSEKEASRWFTLKGIEHLEKALAKGRGVIIFTAHFGNWELAALSLPLLYRPFVILYRPLDNRILDELVYMVRTSRGNILLPKEKSMFKIYNYLRKNAIVGILIDQNVAKKEGVFVDFFGRPACTTTGLAELALRSGAEVLPSFAVRLPEGKYGIYIGESIPVVRTGNWEEDIRRNTENFTKVVEDMVKKHPEQWFWMHHRWKTKPYQEN